MLVRKFMKLQLFALLLSSCQSTRPQSLGVQGGSLSPCPDKPNCVSSQAEGDAHLVSAIDFEGPASDAMARLVSIISRMENSKIIDKNDNYLYAEFESSVFRFVDDVEFYLNPEQARIEVRSASRLGYSDLGVNRERVEAIRAAFAE